MKTKLPLLLTFLISLSLSGWAQAKKPPKPSPTPIRKSDNAPFIPKPDDTASDLITQGKTLYRTAKFKPALARFEAALKLEPDHDEALGLAAETAFRLDLQDSARGYFLRRAEAAGQRDSVKVFSYYRVALGYWREAHDLIAKYAENKDGVVTYKLPEGTLAEATADIRKGLENVERALAISINFAEAYNVRNLLHAEAALAESDHKKSEEHRQQAIESLRRASLLAKPAPEGKAAEIADFGYPILRISEFARTPEEEAKLHDPMMKMLVGGKPIKRTQPVFPSVRSSKTPLSDPNDPSAKGVTSEGGAYSLGTGRGALTAAYAPGIVKVEVLVSTEGKVVFAHVVDGRSDLNGAAVLAARAWTFEPATFEDRPVQVSGVMTFEMKPGRAKAAPAKKP